jgi:hypothetical protein
VSLADANATVTVQIANIKDAAGSPVTGVPGLPNLVVRDAPALPGVVLDLPIVAWPATTTSPSYSAELVATSSRGGLARLPLTVKFPGVQEATVTSGPVAVLRKPVGDPVEISATKLVPTLVAQPFGIKEPWFDTPSISVAPDLANGTIGTLQSATGDVAEAAIVLPSPQGSGLPELRVTGYRSADVYSGKFEAGAGDTATTTTIKLSVRDNIVWAAVALLIGLYLATKLESFLGQDRPRRRFRLFLAKEQDRAAQLVMDQRRQFANIAPAIRPKSPIKIFARGRRGRATGLLATAATRALDDFDSAWSRADRDKKWSPQGDGALAYSKYVDTLGQIAARVRDTSGIVTDLARYADAEPITQMPAVAAARTAVAGVLIESPEDLDAKGKSVTDAMPLLLILVAAFEREADYRRQLTELEKPVTTLDPIKARLDGVDVRDTAAVASIVTELDEAFAAIVRPKPNVARPNDGLAAGMINGFAPDVYVEGVPATEPFESSDVIAAVLRDRERRYALLSAGLVLGTGLSLLYFTDSSWGSMGDYLAALVWGTTVGAGLQLAKGFSDGLPATS